MSPAQWLLVLFTRRIREKHRVTGTKLFIGGKENFWWSQKKDTTLVQRVSLVLAKDKAQGPGLSTSAHVEVGL